MASTRPLQANRRNAQRSTGPRTPAGKARSALNATTHGLRARQPLLLDEDPAEYDRLRDRLVDVYVPDGVTEELLVNEIVGLVWRLWRAEKVEVTLYSIGGSAPVLEA